MTENQAPRDTLIHIGDIHFWKLIMNPFRLLNKRALGNLNVWLRRRHEFDTSQAEDFSDVVAATGVRYAVLTGDFTSTSTKHEFELGRAFVQGLTDRGLTCSVMPGNHDVYTFGSARNQQFQYHFQGLFPEDGLPALKILPGGTPLVSVPTVTPNILSSKGLITDHEIEETRELITGGAEAHARADTPIIVAGHYPVLQQTYAYHTPEDRHLRNAGKLREMLGALNRPILYAAGHVHRFSHVQDPDYPKLYHLTTGAFLMRDDKRKTHGEFSEIHVEPNRCRVFRHAYYGSWSHSEEPPRVGAETGAA